MTEPRRVPAHLEAYVRILGVDGAIAYFLRFGGGELYLPQRPPPPAVLVAVVGIDAATLLCAAASRLPKRVPTAKPWIAQVWKARGLSVTEIARTLHVTDVTVRGWLKSMPKTPRPRSVDPRQIPLL